MPRVGFGAASPSGLNDGVGPVFDGDRDRARSVWHQHHRYRFQCVVELICTCSPGLSFLPGLQQFLLRSLGSFHLFLTLL